jgi:hypothetical protein
LLIICSVFVANLLRTNRINGTEADTFCIADASSEVMLVRRVIRLLADGGLSLVSVKFSKRAKFSLVKCDFFLGVTKSGGAILRRVVLRGVKESIDPVSDIVSRFTFNGVR